MEIESLNEIVADCNNIFSSIVTLKNKVYDNIQKLSSLQATRPRTQNRPQSVDIIQSTQTFQNLDNRLLVENQDIKARPRPRENYPIIEQGDHDKIFDDRNLDKQNSK